MFRALAGPFAFYLRGLSLPRMGFVLLLTTMIVARQYSACYPSSCGLAVGNYAEGARFFARHFVSWLPMLFLVTVADNSTSNASSRMRLMAYMGAVLVGAVAYALMFGAMQPQRYLDATRGVRSIYFFMFFSRSLLFGGLAAGLLFWFTRERQDRRRLHEANLARLALDRQAIEARLQTLQAQIEPHFLFNTLANVRLLYEVDKPRARLLIQDLGDYLRAALPQMRETTSTLGREVSLALAYLRVLAVRMGDRLQFEVAVPAELEGASFPPMMLLTLVENAIKHGLNPRTGGGRITIRAERVTSGLRIVVADDGVGFRKSRGGGVGLANTRTRLVTLYGDAASLHLEANSSRGVAAIIELPHRSGDASLQ